MKMLTGVLIGAGLALTAIQSVSNAQGDPYTWPAYSPSLSYDFRDEFPSLKEPTKDRADCNEVGTIADGWWTFKWGPNKNPLVTEAAIRPLLARMNKDFAYFRDEMGWPPDKRAKEGFRSAIYLFGSGLCTDTLPNTALGGWQSSISRYPMVLLSYYPVYSFDPKCTYNDRVSQQGACVHEGIHSILADLPGCKDAAWFHEGGNTWLQQQATAEQSGRFSGMGQLNGASMLAPFMPIECYSGWLQDGSFGGPKAEGVDEYSGSTKLCTWRKYLGGVQYSNIFPTWLGEWMGVKSIAWIWRNCPSRVLEGMAAKLGDEQIRRLITEYRAKQATIDFGKWTDATKQALGIYFGANLEEEYKPFKIDVEPWKATPYAKTTNNNGTLTPEARTNPGWSGANQIPLSVSGNMVTVDFQPIDANMRCVLAYRATDGTAVYSEPVSSGACSLRLDKAPAGGVVIAVIVNTDYVYKGEETRKKHYDYRLKLGTGVTGTADIYTKWYDVKMISVGVDDDIKINKAIAKGASRMTIVPAGKNMVTLDYAVDRDGPVSIAVYQSSGILVSQFSGYKQAGHYTEQLTLSKGTLPAGTYIMQLNSNAGVTAKPFIMIE